MISSNPHNNLHTHAHTHTDVTGDHLIFPNKKFPSTVFKSEALVADCVLRNDQESHNMCKSWSKLCLESSSSVQIQSSR